MCHVPCHTLADSGLQHERGVLVQHGVPKRPYEVGGAAEGVREAASRALGAGHSRLFRQSEFILCFVDLQGERAAPK